MTNKKQLLSFLINKNKTEFWFYSYLELSCLYLQFRFNNLDNLNQASFWVCYLVFKIIFWKKPLLLIKNVKTNYFKSTFFVTINVIENGYNSILVAYNLNIILKSVFNVQYKNKNYYMYYEIAGLPYIRNNDIRSEFYRWNSILKVFFYPPYSYPSNKFNDIVLNYYKLKIYA